MKLWSKPLAGLLKLTGVIAMLAFASPASHAQEAAAPAAEAAAAVAETPAPAEEAPAFTDMDSFAASPG